MESVNEYLNFMQIWTNRLNLGVGRRLWVSSSQLPEGGSLGLGCRKVVFLHREARPEGAFQENAGSAGIGLPQGLPCAQLNPGPGRARRSGVCRGPQCSLVLAITSTVPRLPHRFPGESHSSWFSGSWAVQACAAGCKFSSHQPAAGGGQGQYTPPEPRACQAA